MVGGMWVREIVVTLLVMMALLAIYGVLVLVYRNPPPEYGIASLPALGLLDSN